MSKSWLESLRHGGFGRLPLIFAAGLLLVVLGACNQARPQELATSAVVEPGDVIMLQGDGEPVALQAQTVEGTITIGLPERTDIVQVEYFVDVLPGTDDVTPQSLVHHHPFAMDFDTTLLEEGAHTVVLRITYANARRWGARLVKVGFQVRNGDQRANRAPVVRAGSAFTVAPGTDAALVGSVSDDGLPDGHLTVRWSMMSGPGTPEFSTPNAAKTTVRFPEPGMYVLRLTADDGEKSSQDDVTVTVTANPAANASPTVSAGRDLLITMPSDATLNGSVSDDGLPSGNLEVHWAQSSGPGTVTFSDPKEATSRASFSMSGTYVLSLTASDGQLSSSDTVTITVEAQPVPPSQNKGPVVNAGPDLSAAPSEKVTLAGSASDDGNPSDSLNVAWSKASGPGTVTFANAANASTTATFSRAGKYVLRLTADDGELSTTDTVTVVVRADEPPPTGSPEPPTGNDLELVGNPDFDVDSLPAETRLWYDRFLNALDNPNQYPNSERSARTGDLYQLGRVVSTGVTTTLTVFRLTGDLRLLDYVDQVMEIARGQLKDYNGDGYPNWRWLMDSSARGYYGDDYHVMDELMTHSMVAEIAWAYHQNRNLTSPTGVDYQERADFWSHYRQQWESKWRARNNKPTGFPFIERHITHPYVALIRYLWYTYRLTNDQGYLTEATRLANNFKQNEFASITTSGGPGLVWRYSVMSAGGTENYLQPTHYARYTVQMIMDMALDGFSNFTVANALTPIANTVIAKVIDNGSTSFASTIGGDAAAGGFAYPPMGEPRRVSEDWANWEYSEYAPFDATGTIATINAQVYAANERYRLESPNRISIPAAMVINDLMNNPSRGPMNPVTVAHTH